MSNSVVLDIQRILQKALNYHNQGQYDQAQNLYNSVLKKDPQNPLALHYLGMIHFIKKEYNVATSLVEQAMSYNPDDATIKINLASIYKELTIYSAAENLLKDALAINPQMPQAYYNLGNLYKDQEKFLDAIQQYKLALSLRANHPSTWLNLGNCYKELNQFDDALNSYNKTLELDPANFLCFNNIGSLYRKHSQSQTAIEFFNSSINANPIYAESWRNLALCNFDIKEFSKAHEFFDKAIKLGDNSLAAFHKANLLLLEQNYDEGFILYEKRFETNFISKKEYDFPYWNNEDLTDKTILLWGEQAVGDEIMYSLLLNDIYKKAKKVYLEINHRLVPIFQRTFPNAHIVANKKEIDPNFTKEKIDYQFPFLSLGKFIKPHIIKDQRDLFLQIDANKKQYFVDKYTYLFPGKPLIGISWQSKNDIIGNRNITLRCMLPIFQANPNIQFINLQYGDVKDEIAEFNKKYQTSIYFDGEIDSLQNMDDFMAQISVLDAVLSIGNTTIHAAASQNKPCILMLPFVPSWRWGLDNNNMWYNNLTIFRQSQLHDWQEVISQTSKYINSTFS